MLDLAGRTDESGEVADKLIAVLDRLGLDRGIAVSLRLNVAADQLWSGDPRGVETIARDLMAFGLEGNTGIMSRIVFAEALVQQDRLDEAGSVLDELDLPSVPPDAAFLIEDYGLLRAEIAAERADHVAVAEALAEALDTDHPGPHQREYPPRLLAVGIRVEADRAEAARGQGDGPALEDALARGRACADRLAAFTKAS